MLWCVTCTGHCKIHRVWPGCGNASLVIMSLKRRMCVLSCSPCQMFLIIKRLRVCRDGSKSYNKKQIKTVASCLSATNVRDPPRGVILPFLCVTRPPLNLPLLILSHHDALRLVYVDVLLFALIYADDLVEQDPSQRKVDFAEVKVCEGTLAQTHTAL
jgi:hypothetical protein